MVKRDWHYKWMAVDPEKVEKNHLMVIRTRMDSSGKTIFQRRVICRCKREGEHG